MRKFLVILIFFWSLGAFAQTATINLNQTYQSISGFGAMSFPRWQTITTNDVTTGYGTGAGQLGLSIMRISCAPVQSDWSKEVPLAKTAYNLGAKIFATPWSPPANLKDNNSIIKGSLKTDSYGSYVTWLNQFVSYMSTNGAPLHAISIQNEPDWLPDYESCGWTTTQMYNFIKNNAGGINTKVIAAEALGFNKAYTDGILNDASAAANLDIVGTHLYGTPVANYSYPLATQKGKEIWMTEHITTSDVDGNSWPDALVLGKEIHDCMQNNFSAYVWWYLRRFYGLIHDGGAPAGGTASAAAGTVTKRGYVMSHFSKFVRPGFVRIAATATPTTNVSVTAFKKDNDFVIVAVNQNSTSKTIQFSLSGSTATGLRKYVTTSSKNVVNEGLASVSNGTVSITLEANSIYTFVSEQTSNPPSNGVTTYVNPILPGDHPDQTLLRRGKDFYSTGSNFHFTPYLPILHSTDLMHWEVIARVIPPTSSIPNNDLPSNGTWQGALAYFNNKYWVYFSNNAGGGQYFCNATNPSGPWSTPVKVNGVYGYDNSIFVDDDGTPYMLMKNGQDNNGIQKLGTDGQPSGTALNLNWVNANGHPYSWAEGPVMCKRNGRYYYFVAGNVTGGQYVLSSATLTADESQWTRHGNFWQTATSPGGFTGPNHITQPVILDDGTWWCLSHAYDNGGWEGQGRQSHLHQVVWDANGVPKGIPVSTNPVTGPNLPSSGINYDFVKSDYFNSTALSLNWHFLNKAYASTSRYSLSDRTGYLKLKPGNDTTHILQKDKGKYYSLTTKIDFNATANGQQAGIKMTNGIDGLYFMLYSGYNNGKKLGVYFNGSRTEVTNSIGNMLWLRVDRSLHILTSYYSADGIAWTQLGTTTDVTNLDKSQANYNSWVGTSVGLFALNANADFDQFLYRDGLAPLKIGGYNNYYGTSIVTKTPGSVVTNTADGDWCMLAGVSIGQDGATVNSIELNAASASSSGSLEVWIDNIGGSGTKIATIPITSSGGTDVWKNYTAAVTASGQHDLYFKFIGTGGAFSLNTVRFLTQSCTTVAPTVTSPITYCQGATATALTATGTSLKWYIVASDGTASTTAPIPSTTNSGTTNYYVSQTLNGCEGPRSLIAVTVNANPVATITPSGPTTFCQGSGNVTLNANTGTGLNYVWKNGTNQVGGNSASQAIYITSGSYSVEVTDANGCKATSAPVTVTVNTPPAAPSVSDISFCQNTIATALTATGTSLKWYGTSQTGGTASTTAPTPGTVTVGTTAYYVSQTMNNCEGPRASITVTVNANPFATITPSGPTTFCQGSGNVTLNANTGAGLNYVWRNGLNQIGSNLATHSIYITSGSYTVEVTDANGCKSTSVPVTVTVNTPPAAPIVSDVIYCQNATATALAATGANLKWYTVAQNGTGSSTAPIPSTSTAGSTNYYVSQTTNSCEGPRATIAVTVNALPSIPTVTSPVTYCQNATAAELTATGTNLKWYTVAQNGTGSSTAPTPSTSTAGTTNYYVSQTINSCEGPRASIAVAVNALPSVPLVTTPVTYCQNATATALAATGTNLKWYTVAQNGTGSLTAPIPSTSTAGTTNYYVSQTTNSCEGPGATISVNVNELPVAAITPAGPTTFTEGGSVILNASTEPGVDYNWFKGNTLVGTGASYTATLAGDYSLEAMSELGCKSTSLATIITVTGVVNQPSVITIISPKENSTASGSVTIEVNVSDPDGSIALVQYLDGTTIIGSSIIEPYNFTWDNPSVGSHELVIRVTDSEGGITTSNPITFEVTTATGIVSSGELSLVSISPNPSSESFKIETSAKIKSFKLLNVYGEVVEVINELNDKQKVEIGSGISGGTYLLSVEYISGVVEVYKLVKVK